MQADPTKIEALQVVEAPSNVSELKSFLDIVNLKKSLVESTVLGNYDVKVETKLIVDASPTGF